MIVSIIHYVLHGASRVRDACVGRVACVFI